MSDDASELIAGSGNVYRDFGYPDANLRQARAVVAACIIRFLDEQQLSIRDAEKRTGAAHTEFSRIRNARLDRLIVIVGDDAEVELEVRVSPRAAPRSAPHSV